FRVPVGGEVVVEVDGGGVLALVGTAVEEVVVAAPVADRVGQVERRRVPVEEVQPGGVVVAAPGLRVPSQGPAGGPRSGPEQAAGRLVDLGVEDRDAVGGLGLPGRVPAAAGPVVEDGHDRVLVAVLVEFREAPRGVHHVLVGGEGDGQDGAGAAGRRPLGAALPAIADQAGAGRLRALEALVDEAGPGVEGGQLGAGPHAAV